MSQEDPSTLVVACATTHVDLTATSYGAPIVFGGVTLATQDLVFLTKQATDPEDGIYRITFDTPSTPTNVLWTKVCDADPLAFLTCKLRLFGAQYSIDVLFDKYQEEFAKNRKTLVLYYETFGYKHKLQKRESVTEITRCKARLWAPNWGDLRTLRSFFVTKSREFTDGSFSLPDEIEAGKRKAVSYGSELLMDFELSYQLPVWGPMVDTVNITGDEIDFTDTPGDNMIGNPNP